MGPSGEEEGKLPSAGPIQTEGSFPEDDRGLIRHRDGQDSTFASAGRKPPP